MSSIEQLLQLNSAGHWKGAKTIDGCTFEVASVSQSDKKASRITVDIHCGAQLFEAFISTPRNSFLFEPTLQSIEVFTSNAEKRTCVLHTKYAAQGVISARDFCTEVTTAVYHQSDDATQPDALVGQLWRDNAGSDTVFVSAGVSCNDVPVIPSFTRGEVVTYGFIAIGFNRGESIRLIQISHVDPKGSIPTVALDAALPDGCKKMSRIKDLCEALTNMIANMKLVLPSQPVAVVEPGPTAVKSADVEPAADSSAGTVIKEASRPVKDDAPRATAPEAAAPAHVDPVVAAPRFVSTPVSAGLRNTLSRTLALQSASGWTAVKTLENCLLEETMTTFSDKKAYRISTKVNCSLATLEAFLNDDSQLRKYDPQLDLYEVIAEAEAGRVIYSSYKRQSSFITPRDFCTVTGAATFYGDDVKSEGLGSENGAALVVGCISCNAKPEQKGFIRGTIVSYGFVALAASPTSSTIKMFNIMCVDPNGSIPKWMLDIATADACKKIAAMRRMCEEKELKKPAAPLARAVPNPAPVAAPPKEATPPLHVPSSSADDSPSMASLADQQAFFEREVNDIIANLTKLHSMRGWEEQKFVSDCKLETMLTPHCDKKAVRVSAEFKCSLQTFLSVICNVEYVRKYDPGLAVMQPLDSPPFASVLYTAYKSNTKLVTARDFCTMTATKLLSETEGADAGLYTRGMRAAAFVLSSVNCKDMPEQKGFVRGTIHAYGYIAVAMPPTADRIRVFNLALVDPMGSIPAKLVDAAMGETCKKLEVIRNICAAEQRGGKAQVLQLVTPALAAQEQTFPSIDEDPIIRKITRLHGIREWPNQRQMGAVLVQFGPSDVNPDVVAYRCSTEFMCSLKSFASFVNSSDNIRRTDDEVEFVRFLDGPPNATISHAAYRAGSRVYPSTDITMLTVTKSFEGVEGSDAGLYTAGITSAAFVANSINWLPKGVESPPGYTRATVVYNGLVAIATPPAAARIRVFSYSAIEGKSIKHSDDVRIHDCCARLAALRMQCEQLQTAADLQEIKEEVVSETGVPVEAESTPSVCSEASSETFTTVPADGAAQAEELVTSAQRKVLAKLLQLNNRNDWRMGKVVDRCVLEDCDVNFCDKKALRITTDVNCTLDRFEQFIADVDAVRKYDPTLDVFEVVKKDADSMVVYSAYKRQSSFVAPRDFCSQVVRVRLPGDVAASEAGIVGCHEAIVQNAISVPAKGIQAGFVRGFVHSFGFIATASSPGSTKITVTNIMSVDPCGSIPKWVMDAASGESCKKLALIRSLCEGK
jgi:hypothetical protein